MEILNVGKAMNLRSGIFKAPRTGIYFFAFTGFANFPGSSSRLNLFVDMFLNGKAIGRGHADELGNAQQYGTFSFQSTIDLQAGDQIWLEIGGGSPRAYLDDRYVHHNHFSGWSLEENVSDSLNIK